MNLGPSVQSSDGFSPHAAGRAARVADVVATLSRDLQGQEFLKTHHSLVHAHDRGTLFLQIAAECLYSDEGYENAEAFIKARSGYHHTRQNLFCVIASHLTQEQVEQLGRASPDVVYLIFATSREGKKQGLPAMIRKALLDRLPQERWSRKKMVLVRQELLRRLELQSEMQVLAELDQAIEAALPTAEDEFKVKLNGMLQAIERSGDRERILEKLSRDPEVHTMLACLMNRRANERDEPESGPHGGGSPPAPAPPAPPKLPVPESSAATPSSTASVLPTPPPAPAPSAPAPPPPESPAGTTTSTASVLPNPPDAPESPAGASPDLDPEAPVVPAPAPRPDRLSPYQRDIPVPYPAQDYDVTSSERLGCCMIIALFLAAKDAATIVEMWKAHVFQASYRLCHRLMGPIVGFLTMYDAMRPRLAPAAAQGRALLQEQGLPLPLSLDPKDGEALPMDWVSYEALDPLHDPDPSLLERRIVNLFGLLGYLHKTGLLWYAEALTGQLFEHTLAHQYYEIWGLCHSHLLQVMGHMETFAQLGAEEEREAEEQRRLRHEYFQLYKNAILVAGENGLPEQFTIVGITREGYPVAISQNTPQFIVILGRTGSGKTHIAMLLMEGSVVPYEGLGEIKKPPLFIRFSSDCLQGVRGDELRAGFYPNTDPEQWEYLQQHYNIDRWDLCIQGATLLGLRKSLPGYHRKYADLVERGLMIEALTMDPSEVGLFGYVTYLNGGAEARKRGGQQMYQKIIASIIGWKGEDCLPEVIETELLKHKIDSRVMGALKLQLDQLKEIVIKGGHVVRHLARRWPMMVDIEGRFIGAEQINPLQVIASNALSRPLLDGSDPLRWHVHDEGHGDMETAAGRRYMQLSGELRRHHTTSHVLAAQRASDIPRGVAPQATVVIQMNTDSEDEFRVTKRRFGVFHDVSYHDEIRTLNDGQGLMGASRANSSLLTKRALAVDFRPSILDVRGETFQYVGGRKGEEEEGEDDDDGEDGEE